MTTGLVSESTQCPRCYWFVGYNGEYQICFAFPKGIPDDILTGRFDHRLPYEGDAGSRWKEDEELTKFVENQEV